MSEPNDPFDRRMQDLRGSAAADVVTSATEVRDLLQTAWAAAQSVFGDRATPDTAMAIYDRMLARAKESPSRGHREIETAELNVEMGGFRVDDL